MNRETLRLTFFAGVCIGLASCATTPQVSVKTDYNHKTSFSGYKTYALDLSEAPELRPTGREALTDSLKSSLAARGITEAGKAIGGPGCGTGRFYSSQATYYADAKYDLRSARIAAMARAIGI